MKMWRPGMLLGGAGTVVGFTLLTVVLGMLVATETAPAEQDGPPTQTIGQFSAAGGFAEALGGAATFLGVVALAISAISAASEYSKGTIRALLVRQPRRVTLLAGTIAGVLAFLALAVLLAAVLSFAVALLIAPGQGIDPAAWTSTDGLVGSAQAAMNLVLSVLGWGLL